MSGLGGGALWGALRCPGLGLVPAAGQVEWDDFILTNGEAVAGRAGDLLWAQNTIVGAPAWASQTPTAYTEAGILRVTTTAVSGEGGSLTRGTTAPYYRFPGPGSIWAVKLRMITGTSSYELWSGFSASATNRVAAANTTDFIGVRSEGGNLFGVVKQAASPSETTQDLGFDCEGSTWRIVGFEVKGTTGAPSVQFFSLDASRNDYFDRTDIGSPITATMPNTTLRALAMGLVTTAASARAAEIDFWALGGRTAR